MLGLDLVCLGNRIRKARKECGLTQKELANQTKLSVKTIQDIERGRKNPTYETLMRLMERLGIPPDALFQTKVLIPADEMQQVLENFHSCNPENKGILLRTLHFLAEQLRTSQEESEV